MRPAQRRVGIGFDIHRLKRGRPFVLAGVRIPNPLGAGPDGHSDADPLCHAVVDALLGAVALGDIGERFPDSDPRWRGTPGPEFLRRTRAILARAGWRPVNVDATVFCERPRLGPYKRAVAAALAKALGLQASAVSVKAKTMEGLGPIGTGGAGGAGKALAAQAVALLAPYSRRG